MLDATEIDGKWNHREAYASQEAFHMRKKEIFIKLLAQSPESEVYSHLRAAN